MTGRSARPKRGRPDLHLERVLRTLQVFEAVARNQPVRVGQLTPIVGLPKSTVQRILGTLAEGDWIEPLEGDHTRWKLSGRILDIIQPSRLLDVDLRACAVQPMQELCTETNETSHLFVPSGHTHVVVIDRADCARSIRTVIPIGSVLPAVGSAAGLAMLAEASDEVLQEAIDAAKEHRGGVTDTPTAEQINLLPQLVASARRMGFAKRLAWGGDVVGIGAAIRDRSGRVIAGVSLSVPVNRFANSASDDWGSLVIRCADRISEALGFVPSTDDAPAA